MFGHPIPFISDTGIRRQTSSRVRFPDQDDDDLLLDVLPFPEERLAQEQRVQVWSSGSHGQRNLHHYFRQLWVEVEQPQGLLKSRRGHFLSRRALTESGTASRNRDSTCLGEMDREASTGRLPCLEYKVKQWILLGERLSRILILLLILFRKQKLLQIHCWKNFSTEIESVYLEMTTIFRHQQ